MISEITTQKITEVMLEEIGLEPAKKLVSRLILIHGNASFRLSMEAVRNELEKKEVTELPQ